MTTAMVVHHLKEFILAQKAEGGGRGGGRDGGVVSSISAGKVCWCCCGWLL